jgi:hypothetical protein
MFLRYKIIVDSYYEYPPLHYEIFFSSIAGLRLKNVTLGIIKDLESLYFFIEFDQKDKLKLLNILKTFFAKSDFVEMKSVDTKYKFCTNFGLKNVPFFSLKNYESFAHKFEKSYVNPMDNLVSYLESRSMARIEFNFAGFSRSAQTRCLKLEAFFISCSLFWLKRLVYIFLKNKFLYLVLRLFIFIDFSQTVQKSESKFSESLLKVSLQYSSDSSDDLNFFWSNFSSKDNWIIKKYFRVKEAFSVKELATIFRFPSLSYLTESAVEKTTYVKVLPEQVSCIDPTAGVCVLDENGKKVYLTDEDRFRHQFLIGKTGTGKSTMLKSLILQDINAGRGVCLIDPHGDLAEQILMGFPKNRTNDLILIDPSDEKFSVCFNPLDVANKSQKNLVAGNLVEVFKVIFGFSWGPRLEYYLKNALLLLVDVGGSTLLDLPRLFNDIGFLKSLLLKVKDPFLVKFFENEYIELSPQQRTEIVSPILNKVGPLLLDPILRNVFSVAKSKVDLRQLMDKKKVIIFNLSKGKIGSLNSSFLGAIFMAMIQSSVLSRADQSAELRVPFYLYVDEFQNMATSSMVEALSESRKYSLSLNLATQFLAQLDEKLQQAILGNVANFFIFKLSYEDADIFFRQFAERIPLNCFLNLPKFKTYVSVNQRIFSANPCLVNSIGFEVPDLMKIKRLTSASNGRYSLKKSVIENSLKKRIL